MHALRTVEEALAVAKRRVRDAAVALEEAREACSALIAQREMLLVPGIPLQVPGMSPAMVAASGMQEASPRHRPANAPPEAPEAPKDAGMPAASSQDAKGSSHAKADPGIPPLVLPPAAGIRRVQLIGGTLASPPARHSQEPPDASQGPQASDDPLGIRDGWTKGRGILRMPTAMWTCIWPLLPPS